MKPICVRCERFMRPKKNGFRFIEGMPIRNGALPGKAEPLSWKPYKIWAGDLWHCPDCGSHIVVGTGAHPVTEHYKPEFSPELDALGATPLFVKDC